MTTVTSRPVPDGYTEKWDKTVWNNGFVFRWSEAYDDWLKCELVVTVKPGQSLWTAFEAHTGGPMWDEYTIFFSSDENDPRDKHFDIDNFDEYTTFFNSDT